MHSNKKKNIIILILSAVCILTALVVLDRFVISKGGLKFSKESGFYEEEFKLSITGNSFTKIFYTLDGSFPYADQDLAIEYKGEIVISDASNNENVYSLRKDVTPYLNEELMSKYGKKENPYVIPEYLVDKCNVVRAAMYDMGGNLIEEKTEVYFVGFDKKQGYEGLYTVSLSTDKDNLFDYETGIYVTGRAMDEFYDFENTGEWDWNANYYGKGSEWEKPGYIAVFDENRQEVLKDNIRMRIQGGSTRSNLQKSFNIYPIDDKGEHSEFPVDLFGNGFNTDKFRLATGGNDYRMKLKDLLVIKTDEQYNSDDIHNKMIPANVFLNGEYWGVYYITDSFTKRYMAHKCDTSEDNIVYIKNGEIELGEDKDISLYESLKEFLDTSDLSNNNEYDEFCKMVDIDSMVNYYATQLYISNMDYINNYVLWRTKTSKGTHLSDGKWRFVLFDLNHTTAMQVAAYDMMPYVLENDSIFAAVYKNKDFRKCLADKYMELSKTRYSAENVGNFIEKYENKMRQPMTNNEKRFFGGTYDNVEDEISKITAFFKERPLFNEGIVTDIYGE